MSRTRCGCRLSSQDSCDGNRAAAGDVVQSHLERQPPCPRICSIPRLRVLGHEGENSRRKVQNVRAHSPVHASGIFGLSNKSGGRCRPESRQMGLKMATLDALTLRVDFRCLYANGGLGRGRSWPPCVLLSTLLPTRRTRDEVSRWATPGQDVASDLESTGLSCLAKGKALRRRPRWCDRVAHALL